MCVKRQKFARLSLFVCDALGGPTGQTGIYSLQGDVKWAFGANGFIVGGTLTKRFLAARAASDACIYICELMAFLFVKSAVMGTG